MSSSEEPLELEEAVGEVGGSMIDGGGTDSPAPNAAFLLELNLVLMLSFLSLSAEEECLNTGEAAAKNKAKVNSSSSRDHPSRMAMAPSIPRFQTRRREASDFRLVANRDCRHGRRM